MKMISAPNKPPPPSKYIAEYPAAANIGTTAKVVIIFFSAAPGPHDHAAALVIKACFLRDCILPVPEVHPALYSAVALRRFAGRIRIFSAYQSFDCGLIF